jgi:hypothetical protein
VEPISSAFETLAEISAGLLGFSERSSSALANAW